MLEIIFFYVKKVVTNPIFLTVFFSWFTAQVIKAAIWHFHKDQNFFKSFFKSGGMPSAHAASMVALTLSVLITTGLSTVFYLATILMIIVIHDAVRSRYLVGLHSKILNKQLKGRKLEENVGHTLWEVFWGVVIGIGIVIVVFALI